MPDVQTENTPIVPSEAQAPETVSDIPAQPEASTEADIAPVAPESPIGADTPVPVAHSYAVPD